MGETMRISLNEALNISAILLGLPYFLGFVYQNTYFQYFGIDAHELEVKTQVIYVSAFYALNTVSENWFSSPNATIHILFLLSLLLALFVLLHIYRRQVTLLGSSKPNEPRKRTGISEIAIVLLGYFLALVALYAIGFTAGQSQAEDEIGDLPMVMVVSAEKAGAQNTLDTLSPEGVMLKHTKHRLLYTSATTFYLVRRTLEQEKIWLIRLPRHESRIVYARKVLHK